ncbi:MAG: MaoC family dehydratase [Nanoarchaeota archaeon]|nr:MaoC family dehydratase [Nanoarchaeota archaeon]
MTKIFSVLSRLVKPDGQETSEEKLEDKINQVLAKEKEKIYPTTEDIERFGWVTGDNNPVHRLKSRAKKMGFDNTPIMGAHMAAYGEQYIVGAVQTIREYVSSDLKIIGQKTKFTAPIYPQENMWWQVKGAQEKGDTRFDLSITGEVKGKPNRNTVVEITSRLGSAYPAMPQIAGPLHSRKYLLELDHLEEFYNSVGGKYAGKVPHSLTAAFVPATLLQLLEERAHTMEGANLVMDFDFLNDSQLGLMQVDIFPPERPPRERKGKDPNTGEQKVEGYIYQFRAVVSQKTKPILYGEIMSFTPKKIDLISNST